MKYKYLFIAVFFGLCVKAQNIYQKSIGGTDDESGFFVQQCHDHGYVMGGFTQNYGDGIYLVKTDSTATVQWSKVYHGGSHQDQGYAVRQTSDNGFILAGYTKSFSNTGYNATLIKTNATGDTLWTGIYGGNRNDYGNVVRETSDGGYIMAGYTISYQMGADSGSIYLIKTGHMGDVKWSKSIGHQNISDAYSIEQTADKGFMITGYTNAFAEPNGDAFFIKTDSLGNPVFTKTYGFKGSDWGNSMQKTLDGGYIITGGYSVDSTSVDVDVLAIKTDANGDTVWVKTYGGPGFDCGQSVRQAADGTYIIAGYTYGTGFGNYDALLLKLDANGNELHQYAYGAAGDDEGNAVFEANDGGYVLCGNSNSFNGGTYYDVYVVKTDAVLNSGCKQMPIFSNGRSHHLVVQTATASAVANATTRQYAPYSVSSGAIVTDACSYVGIEEAASQNPVLRVFPNPASNDLQIHLPESVTAPVMITLTSAWGEIVYRSQETTAPSGLRLSVAKLPAGIYTLEVSSGNRRVASKVSIVH